MVVNHQSHRPAFVPRKHPPKMVFESKLPLPPSPSSDAFSYIFHHGRMQYPASRVLYRVDGTDESLTLRQLEQKSKQLADALRKRYDIVPNDVVAILAKDKVCDVSEVRMQRFLIGVNRSSIPSPTTEHWQPAPWWHPFQHRKKCPRPMSLVGWCRQMPSCS